MEHKLVTLDQKLTNTPFLRNSKRSSSWLTIVTYMFLGLYALVILYPLFFIVMSSLKSNTEIFSNPWGLPKSWSLHVYAEVLQRYNLGIYFFNSFIYSSVSVIITILISAMAAYGIVRMKWKLNTWFFGFIMLGLMIPVHSTLVPLYITISKIGLNYPRIIMILLYTAFNIPFSVFVLCGFIQNIPKEMEESAVIDGCSIFKTYWRIIFPLLKPALATVGIFDFLSSWNDLIFGLVFINDDALMPIQLGIMRFQGAYSSQYSELLSAIVIAIIPTVVVYMIFQKRIIDGITSGAIKG